MEDQVKCPKCNSTQITANKKGYSVGKAAAGVILTGGIGLVAGAIGSGAVKITCLSCGHSWNPKTLNTQRKRQDLVNQQKSNAEYSLWKKRFYSIYEGGDFKRAELHFLEKRVLHKATPTVHEAYKKLKKTDSDNQKVILISLGVISLILGLIIWWAN
jgi:hypothetical protein